MRFCPNGLRSTNRDGHGNHWDRAVSQKSGMKRMRLSGML
jgi:hypothetical protein